MPNKNIADAILSIYLHYKILFSRTKILLLKFRN